MFRTATAAVDHFLRLTRCLQVQTREFRNLRHNADLCPQFQLRLEAVLKAVGRFEPVVYDTQGVRDQGADVVIRVRDQRRSDVEDPELLGFQIKSFADFERPDLMRTLKAQHYDAFQQIRGMSTYFLLLCTDENRHKDTIRNIEAEFKGARGTIVIEPTYALTFYRLQERRIEGYVTRMMQADDLVFQEALKAVQVESPTGGLLLLHLAAELCDGATHISQDSVYRHRGLEEAFKRPWIHAPKQRCAFKILTPPLSRTMMTRMRQSCARS
jgi:hypothetical protein